MQIVTKLNLQDKCFYLHENKVVQDNVTNIKAFVNKSEEPMPEIRIIYVVGKSSDQDEKNVFSSKEELLNSL